MGEAFFLSREERPVDERAPGKQRVRRAVNPGAIATACKSRASPGQSTAPSKSLRKRLILRVHWGKEIVGPSPFREDFEGPFGILDQGAAHEGHPPGGTERRG